MQPRYMPQRIFTVVCEMIQIWKLNIKISCRLVLGLLKGLCPGASGKMSRENKMHKICQNLQLKNGMCNVQMTIAVWISYFEFYFCWNGQKLFFWPFKKVIDNFNPPTNIAIQSICEQTENFRRKRMAKVSHIMYEILNHYYQMYSLLSLIK